MWKDKNRKEKSSQGLKEHLQSVTLGKAVDQLLELNKKGWTCKKQLEE